MEAKDLTEAYKEGMRKVVKWLEENCACFDPNPEEKEIIPGWRAQLKEWGIDKEPEPDHELIRLLRDNGYGVTVGAEETLKKIRELGRRTSTDANGYTSALHVADPSLYNKKCMRCGKIAAWAAGAEKDHGFLCLKCVDDWSKFTETKSFTLRSWDKVFTEFLQT